MNAFLIIIVSLIIGVLIGVIIGGIWVSNQYRKHLKE